MIIKDTPLLRSILDNMKNMPKAENYIKKRLCFDDYESCNRYMIYKEYGGENMPQDFGPDSEEVVKIIQCLKQKEQKSSPGFTGAQI